MEATGGFFDGGFRKARNLEEATGDRRVASGVEGGRGFGFVGSGDRAGVERCGGADVNFNVMQGTFRFDDATPAEGRARLSKRGDFARRFAAVSARFHDS